MVLAFAGQDIRDQVESLTRLVLTVEYDGTRYYGFQLQADAPTIQGELEKALWKLTGERSRVASASRTDAGVHAKGQVVSFRTSSTLVADTFVKGLNYYLPADIAVKEACRADISVNVRKQATSREYSYCILNRPARSPLGSAFSCHVPGHLDIDSMNQACQHLVGTHDFASFVTCSPGIKSTVRRVYRAEVKRDGEMVVFGIEANAFLIHQVRNTVGSLIKVGRGKMAVSEFHRIIEAKEPGLARPAVPACGLFLMRVNYPHHIWGEM